MKGFVLFRSQQLSVFLYGCVTIQYDYTKGQYYKKQYPAGTRVLLVHMNKDPRPIPDNTKGTVRLVDDIGQIHCLFDNGHSHTIVPGVDIFRRLEKDGGQ